MKKFPIALFISIMGVSSVSLAQSGTPPRDAGADAAPTAASGGNARGGSVEDSSGGSGGSGASGAEDEVHGTSGSSSDNPTWEGLGSTGGATGTGVSVGTTADDATSGDSGEPGGAGSAGSDGEQERPERVLPRDPAAEREPAGQRGRDPGGSR